MSKYKFSDFAINCTEKRTPTPDDYSTYIGLEHMDTKCLKISRWGSDVPIIGEKLVMHKGDVLFGKRNTYLRRAAIAPHDGLFSAHGMVLIPNEEIIDKDFFALFICSDYFFDAAIRISVGSLSPTVNWKDIKDLEFNLPTIKKQREIASVIWSILDTIESYKKIIARSDDLIKSQFYRQIASNARIPKVNLGDIFEITAGGTPSRGKIQYWENGSIPWVKITDMKSMYISKTEEKITEEGLKNSSAKLFGAGTFLISIFATLGEVSILNIDAATNQAIAGLVPKYPIDVDYTYIALTQLKEYLLKIGRGAAQNNVNLSILRKIAIPVPNKKLRNEFSKFVAKNGKANLILKNKIRILEKIQNSIFEKCLLNVKGD